MTNSKNKGSRFERSVAKYFTDWTGFTFGRTPYSGAYHKSKDLSSDVMCTDEKHAHRCKLSIECKNYKDINFEHALLGTKGSVIEKFWEQAKRDAERSSKVPILVMRYNSMPKGEFFFVVDSSLGNVIETQLQGKGERSMTIVTPENTLCVYMASAVQKHVNYKSIHKQAKLLVK